MGDQVTRSVRVSMGHRYGAGEKPFQVFVGRIIAQRIGMRIRNNIKIQLSALRALLLPYHYGSLAFHLDIAVSDVG